MLVRDLMIPEVAFCRPDDNLAEITEKMWRKRCGALPVVNDAREVAGMITDRDVCIAVGTRDLKASEILVREVSSLNCFVCSPAQDIREALQTMSSGEVDRLPVVDPSGHLIGILSADDIVGRAGGGTSDLSDAEIIVALRGLREARIRHPYVPVQPECPLDACSRMPSNSAPE
jgi:CBS domain-containing protein